MTPRRADRLYEWLAELPTPDAESILAAGLECAEPAYFGRIVELLFQRGTDAAWAGLIANYPRLSPEIREHLRSGVQQMRSGLLRVLRGGSPPGRCNALQALRDAPEPLLAYVLPDALRASSGDVRRAAAETLRRLAEVVVDAEARNGAGPALATASPRRVEPESPELTAALGEGDHVPGTDGNEFGAGAPRSAATPARQAPGSARAAVAQAVWEALRSFESHYRLEAVEAALWLTRELGSDLWKVLANRRSPVAHVVSANLNAWNSPRLARFLLEALAQPAWRAAARNLLMNWRGPDRLAAILRNSELLASPDFREALNRLRRPSWFVGVDDLRGLPPDLRARAPQWLSLLGYRSDEKRALLTNWSQSAFVELRAAANEALRAVVQEENGETESVVGRLQED